MAYYYSLLFFLLFTFMTCITEGRQHHEVPAIFVLGDSLVDVGNNNHLELSLLKSNFPHNGVDFARGKATGRYSNGKNAADFFTEKLGLATSPPYLSIEHDSNKTKVALDRGGINFASGGAGVLNDTNILFRQTISFNKQIGYYSLVHGELVHKLGAIGTKTYFAKSVFLIAIGSNDILNFFQSGSTLRQNTSPQQYINTLMLTLKGQYQRIYHLGARKFAVVGAGLIGCCPSMRSKNKTGECNEEANQLSVKYNEALQLLLQELKAELKDFNYSLLNTYDIMVDFLQQPAFYGFNDVKAACCGLGKFKAQFPCLPIAIYCKNRRNHLYWDLYHPTEAAAQIVIGSFFNGPQKYVHPINAKQLVSM